jgi:serine protease Do
VFQQIRKTGRVRRGEIGVSTQTITSVLAEALDLPIDAGVIVADVAEGGPGAKAGLQPGDIIHALDGKRMENGRQFRINVYTRTIGDQIGLEVQRGERRLTVRVPVVERETSATRLIDLLTPQNSVRTLGLLGLELTPQIAQVLGPLRGAKGVVVASVSGDAPFSQQGRLQAGDVIYSLNKRPITTIADLKSAAETLKPNAAAVLQIERSGELLFVAFRIDAR